MAAVWSIFLAHRLSAIRHADEIMHEWSDIGERGTHEELLHNVVGTMNSTWIQDRGEIEWNDEEY